MKRFHFATLVLIVCLLLVILFGCKSVSYIPSTPPVKLVIVDLAVEHLHYNVWRVKIVGDSVTHLYKDSFLYIKGDTIIQTSSFIIW